MRPGRPVTLSCAPDPIPTLPTPRVSYCTVLELPSLVSLDVVALAVDGEVGLQVLRGRVRGGVRGGVGVGVGVG